MAWEFSGIYTVQSCCQSVLGLGGGLSASPPIPLSWQRQAYSDLSSALPSICLISIYPTACQNHLKCQKGNGLGRSSI